MSCNSCNSVGTLSFVEMNVDDVRKMCNSTIASIREERIDRDNNTVNNKIEHVNSTIDAKNKLRKFLFLKPLQQITKEQAVELILSESWNYFYPSEYGGGSMKTAKRLLQACDSSCSKTIFVSIQDLDYICGC